MKLFGPMYERALTWAKHPRATWFLALLSFAEAVFFPIPPEVMLAPMSVAQPRRAFTFATISLASSLAGAVVGYLLGHFAYELVKPLFETLGWASHIDQGVQWLSAEAAKSPECSAFFRRVHDADKAQLEEAKQHLVAVLEGKMGSQRS